MYDDASVFELESLSIADSDTLIPHKSFILLKNTATNTWIRASSLRIRYNEDQPLSYKIECSKTKDDKEAFRIIPINNDEVSNVVLNLSILNLNFKIQKNHKN